jgi:pimeloyl-ACP methyl ester carboxylesterase
MKARSAPALALVLSFAGIGGAACGPTLQPPPRAVRVAAGPTSASTGGRTELRGSISLTQALAGYAPHGQLAVGWLTPDEKAALEQGRPLSMRSLRELGTERLMAAGEVSFLTLATQVPYALDLPDGAAARGELVPFALIDVCGNVFGSLLGGCDGSILGFGAATHPTPGQATAADIELTLRRPAPARTEGCAGERHELLRIEAPRTAGTVGNDTHRRACVLLPEGYAKHPARRYPVIYALPGLGGDESAFFRRKVDLDAVEKAAAREAILVSVDTSTRHGSTYLVDSPLEGDFDSFMAVELPIAIDKAYRTLAKPRERGRAVIGQSTGGFNAITVALRHPDLFSAVAAMSPDGLDLGAWLAPDGKTLAPPWLHLARLEDGMKSQGEMTSLAASFSPDATKPRGLAWPCDLATGKLDELVWRRWLAHSPSVMLTDPAILEAARTHLGGRIYVTVAEHDEFDLFDPDRRFVEQLVRAGVPATFVPTAGGHTEGVDERERASLDVLLKALDPAKP